MTMLAKNEEEHQDGWCYHTSWKARLGPQPNTLTTSALVLNAHILAVELPNKSLIIWIHDFLIWTGSLVRRTFTSVKFPYMWDRNFWGETKKEKRNLFLLEKRQELESGNIKFLGGFLRAFYGNTKLGIPFGFHYGNFLLLVSSSRQPGLTKLASHLENLVFQLENQSFFSVIWMLTNLTSLLFVKVFMTTSNQLWPWLPNSLTA